MNFSRLAVAKAAMLLAACASVAAPAHAQIGSSGEPIEVTADKLEVIDAERRAIYSGNVDAVQGKARLRSKLLTIEFNSRNPGSTSQSGLGGSFGSVKKLIADQDVFYVAPEGDKVKGDRAEYDYENDTITITGDITLMRAESEGVIQGRRLVIDVKSGRATVTSEGQRVSSIFSTEDDEDQRPAGNPPTSN